MIDLRTPVAEKCRQLFGASPTWLARAPGRVNLIGEHTDYNDGFVLPIAIDRAAWIAAMARDDRRVVVHSLDFAETAEFSLDDSSFDCGPLQPGWISYVQGVAKELQAAGHSLRGWQGVLVSDVPIGAGLSSSAALELAAARIFAAAGELAWDAPRMARLAQQAENRWVGMQCGIMDQLISACGRANQALLIDCRSLEMSSVPLPADTAVVVLDTSTRRGLVDSAYNERRGQCEAAAATLGIVALRDVDSDALEARRGTLDPIVFRRARHVVTENARTLQAAEAMRRGDSATLGSLMNASHASLRDDYEVSSPALDVMVECAQVQPGCFGARMTGAGFGGCAVALVAATAARQFQQSVAAAYCERTGHDAKIYVCTPTDGAELLAMS